MGMGVILIMGILIIRTTIPTFALGLNLFTDSIIMMAIIMATTMVTTMVTIMDIPEEFTLRGRETGMATDMETTRLRTSLGVLPADLPNSILVTVQEQRWLQ